MYIKEERAYNNKDVELNKAVNSPVYSIER